MCLISILNIPILNKNDSLPRSKDEWDIWIKVWNKCVLLNSVEIYLNGAIKPGLHISRKDRKHRLENMFFKLSSYGLVTMWW